jgi:hypothetical protein
MKRQREKAEKKQKGKEFKGILARKYYSYCNLKGGEDIIF